MYRAQLGVLYKKLPQMPPIKTLFKPLSVYIHHYLSGLPGQYQSGVCQTRMSMFVQWHT